MMTRLKPNDAVIPKRSEGPHNHSGDARIGLRAEDCEGRSSVRARHGTSPSDVRTGLALSSRLRMTRVMVL